MFRKIALAGILAAIAGTASAQSLERQIYNQLRAQGYTNIEIERDDGKIEVEARRRGVEIERVYSARTGRLLKQEIDRDDDDRRRVSRRDRDDDRKNARRGKRDDHKARKGGNRRDDRRRDRDDDDDD